MQVQTVSLTDLSPDPANARTHPERNLEAIAASLRRFGQQKPIVVDAKGVIVAGNGTYEAAKRLGWSEIKIVRTDLIGPDATAFAIADNRTAEPAEWNLPVPKDLLQALDTGEADMDATGFSEADMEAMMTAAPPPGGGDGPDFTHHDQYGVIVMCASEAEQKAVYDELLALGKTCRVVTV